MRQISRAPLNRKPAAFSVVPRSLLIAALVIIGLILMHGMNLHNSHAQSAGASMQEPAAGHHQASSQHPHTAAAAAVPSVNPADCLNCDQQEQAHLAAASCVIAFILVLLVLRKPTTLLLRKVIPARAGPDGNWPTWSVLRAASLVSLCISRT